MVLRRLLLLALTLVAVDWTGCCNNPPSCKVVKPSVGVTTTPAMVVSGVEAVITGPVNGTMVCQPNPPVFAVSCAWPSTVAVVPGTYSLQVSAPGYVTTTVQVVVAVDVPPTVACGCPGDSIKPSTVSISFCQLPFCRPGPADGSVD
jgi:hypothetical protein